MALLTVYACPFTKGQGRVYRISYRTHICTVPLIRKSRNWYAGNQVEMIEDWRLMIHHSLIKTIMMDDRHEEGRHTGASDNCVVFQNFRFGSIVVSMKFPRGLMCRSFQSVSPLRVANCDCLDSVRSRHERLKGSAALWCNNDDDIIGSFAPYELIC